MQRIWDILQRALGRIGGLATIPSAIAVGIWLVTILILVLDAHFPLQSNDETVGVFAVDFGTAKDIVSLVASASITTLGLVYSIVLVVFTTAAGNIGPRLLQRFTGDRVNQVTAGLFGGTYVSALTVLHQSETVFVPVYSATFIYLLAIACMFQLILFVRSAATSVTVDEEVAEISAQLDGEIAQLLDDSPREFARTPPERPEDPSVHIETERNGYISHIRDEEIIGFAAKYDTFVWLNFGPGDFIVKGLQLAVLKDELGAAALDELREILQSSITVSRSRTPDADVEFSINLLVEVALRALSPGVNDTYTAIACCDRISSALALPVQYGLRDGVRADANDMPRMFIPNQTLGAALNTSFGPLRRAGRGNVLMTRHLLEALVRLGELADANALELVQHHAKLVIEEAEESGIHRDDLAFLRKSTRPLLRRRLSKVLDVKEAE